MYIRWLVAIGDGLQDQWSPTHTTNKLQRDSFRWIYVSSRQNVYIYHKSLSSESPTARIARKLPDDLSDVGDPRSRQMGHHLQSLPGRDPFCHARRHHTLADSCRKEAGDREARRRVDCNPP